MAIPFPHHQFTVEDYHRMAEAGILHEDDRVELIDGEIIEMPPIGPEHSGHVNRSLRRFVRLFDDRAVVSVQNPVQLGPRVEPEPDIALLQFRADDYISQTPQADDVLLAIEFADSSLTYDRQTKAPLYARAAVPEYWIVNLVDRVVEVYRDPIDGEYRSVEIARHGDRLSPLAFPDVRIAVNDILA